MLSYIYSDSNKRPRRSSSDSENNQIQPECKQARIKDIPLIVEDMAEGNNQPLSAEKVFNELINIKSVLAELRTEQTILKENLEASIDHVRANVESMSDSISRKFQELHEHIDTETSVLASRLEDVESRINRLEQRPNEPFDPEVTLIGLGIREVSQEIPLEIAKEIINVELDLPEVKVVRAIRIENRNGNGKPGLMKIELSSREDKITVLNRKKKLLESISFKGVFLRSAQSHVERLIQLNFKTILEEIPSGNQFRLTGNGRVVRKTQLGNRFESTKPKVMSQTMEMNNKTNKGSTKDTQNSSQIQIPKHIVPAQPPTTTVVQSLGVSSNLRPEGSVFCSKNVNTRPYVYSWTSCTCIPIL